MSNGKKTLSVEQRTDLLVALKARFENNMRRHESLTWDKVQRRLETHPAKLWSLHEMEKTGGEPDVVGCDSKTDEHVFYDCSAESPAGRRNIVTTGPAGRHGKSKACIQAALLICRTPSVSSC